MHEKQKRCPHGRTPLVELKSVQHITHDNWCGVVDNFLPLHLSSSTSEELFTGFLVLESGSWRLQQVPKSSIFSRSSKIKGLFSWSWKLFLKSLLLFCLPEELEGSPMSTTLWWISVCWEFSSESEQDLSSLHIFLRISLWPPLEDSEQSLFCLLVHFLFNLLERILFCLTSGSRFYIENNMQKVLATWWQKVGKTR